MSTAVSKSPTPVAATATGPSWSGDISVGRRLKGFVALTKPRIVELLLVTTVPTMIVAARGLPSWSLMAATVVGGTLAAGGANALNMVVDRDIDAVMRRTRGRPLVTGIISPMAALVFADRARGDRLRRAVGGGQPALGGPGGERHLVLRVRLHHLAQADLEAEHRDRGRRGAVPVLVGWAAVRGSLGWTPVVLFALIFVWTPPHFWALAIRYRDDYRSAKVPMMPVVASFKSTAAQICGYSVLVVAASLLFAWIARMGPIFWTSAGLLGAVFCLLAFELWRGPSQARAMRLFQWSITYVTLLFGAMAVDQLIFH